MRWKTNPRHARLLGRAALIMLVNAIPISAAEYRFCFETHEAPAGFTQVDPNLPFTPDRGFGFVDGAASAGGVRFFAVDVAEGNYDVTVRFGNPTHATSTTIKAESRRLMVENVTTEPGKYETRTFTVNVHTPALAAGSSVKLKEGEQSSRNWDKQLTLELNGDRPGVASVEIKPAKDAVTVFLAGDSTVTDQGGEPWAGWGQMLPQFFAPGVAVSNVSWSGLTLTSFERQNRLDKILEAMKPGDYLFVQFGHNDQKEKAPNGPFTTYKANLKKYVEAARAKGGVPVIVTPMERRRWKDGQTQATLADFAEAARQAAVETKTPIIDLNAMSLKLYAALGETGSEKAFVFYPANTFPGQRDALKDNTHHSAYGGYELARCVVEGIKQAVPDLARRIANDVGPFDPSHPDAPERVKIAPTPSSAKIEKPAGS